MLWFYRRDKEIITVETRYDNAAREYLLLVQTVDGGQQTERFADVAAFQARLTSAERQLAEGGWQQAGPPIFLPDGWPGP